MVNAFQAILWATNSSRSTDTPIIAYVSYGLFSITNYDPTLVYDTVLVSGAGSAIVNPANGQISLSDINSRFSITSRYSGGTTASNPAYMERKAYTYSCRQVPYQCCTPGACTVTCDPGCGGPGECGNCPNAECGCNRAGFPGWCGCVNVTCSQNCTTCYQDVCDILINQPGYTNSGQEWYRLS